MRSCQRESGNCSRSSASQCPNRIWRGRSSPSAPRVTPITDARGLGSHGKRSGAWAKEGNIRLEILCDEVVSQTIIEHLKRTYDQDYGLLIFSSDVELESS